jgi:hypothetical protein
MGEYKGRMRILTHISGDAHSLLGWLKTVAIGAGLYINKK